MGRNSVEGSKMKEKVGVLDKALTVITVLEKTKDGIGLTEIAQLAGINKTSCYRILNTLMDDGMVEGGERTGTYRLGIRFLELGGIVQRRINLRQVALPALTHLTEKTGDTSFLCILNNLNSVCIERIEGRDVQVLTLNVGDTWPLYIGAAPRAILANLDDELISQILSGPLQTNAMKITDPAVYWEMVREIREKGYSVSFEDVTLGVSSIGAPVYNHKGQVIGSISLSSTIQRLPAEREAEIAQLVVEAAKDISKSLGWAP